MVGVAGFVFSNEKRQKMAICSPVCSPVRPCSPVLDCLNSDMSRPNQRPPAGQPLQGRSTPSTSPARPWLGAAACLGPTTQPPLGGLHNSPKGRLELPARQPSGENLRRGGCPAIGHQAAPSPPVGRCAQGVTTGTAAGPKVAICATQNAQAPAQAKTAFPSVSTFFTGDTGDKL